MKDDRLYLIHILECISRIETYTTGGRAVFMDSPLVQDAVIRNFEVIGEAVKHLSEPVKTKRPDIPWRRISGLRDILIHQYMGVDPDAVWNVIDESLSALKQAVTDILAEIKID